MDDHRLVTQEGRVGRAGKRGPRREEKEWTDCLAEVVVV